MSKQQNFWTVVALTKYVANKIGNEESKRIAKGIFMKGVISRYYNDKNNQSLTVTVLTLYMSCEIIKSLAKMKSTNLNLLRKLKFIFIIFLKKRRKIR